MAIASLKEGEVVLDLGSGAGFDAFLAVQRAGKSGRVIGVDMTLEMIEKKPAPMPKEVTIRLWNSGSVRLRSFQAKVCPVENILLSDEKPSCLKHCQHCMACLQWCPQEAIQYKKMTLDKKRYHHPDIQALDIIGQK